MGIDNLNSYYDPALKQARLERLQQEDGAERFRFLRMDLEDGEAMAALFAAERPGRVVHLAAQAGVRYSLENPAAYIQSNLVGFGHILEGCRHHGAEHLVYASSSSVYGGNRQMPFSEQHPVNHPVSLYAATKKANELMAHTYSHLYGLPATGLRFFTVYGPWGRPDMAPDAVRAGDPGGRADPGVQPRPHAAGFHLHRRHRGGGDPLHRQARHRRSRLRSAAPQSGHRRGAAPGVQHRQLPAHRTAALHRGARAGPRPPGGAGSAADAAGDVPATAADTTALEEWVGFQPSTPIEVGVERFASWYRNYHGV